MKILFKLVSRSRPERFFTTLNNLHSMIDDKANFHIVCTLDEDDETMNNQEVRNRLSEYAYTTPMWGRSHSKIHAFNRDMEDITGWDIVCAVSDDMLFIVYGFDRLIRECFQTNAPDTDGLFHFLDNDAKMAVPVLYIAGRKYYERDLFIYNPIYWSVFCDNESADIAKIRQKYFYTGIQIINHLNPAYGHLPRDAQFDRQQNMWGHDERIYFKRRANNFGFDI